MKNAAAKDSIFPRKFFEWDFRFNPELPQKRGLSDCSTSLMYCIIPTHNYYQLNTMRLARKNCDWRKENSSDAVYLFELLYPTAGINDILPLEDIVGVLVLYVRTCLMAALKENSK